MPEAGNRCGARHQEGHKPVNPAQCWHGYKWPRLVHMSALPDTRAIYLFKSWLGKVVVLNGESLGKGTITTYAP